MADMERMCNLLQNLSTSDDVYSNLVALKTELGALNVNQLQGVVNGVNFSPIFQCLTSPNSDQVDICCSVLERLMTVLSEQILWNDFNSYLLQGLDHSIPHVQMLSLNVLMRLTETHTRELSESQEYVCKLVGMLASSDLYVAGQAAKVLTVIGQQSEGLDILYSGVVFDTLQNVMRLSDTIRYRVLRVILDICCISPPALTRSNQAGLLSTLLSDLNKNDLLLQLNCVELLTDLALTSHGLAYLREQGILDVFMKALVTARSDPFSTVILPSMVKFFGNIARLHPKEIFTQYPCFIDFLLELIASDDVTLSGLAVETVGFIGSSPDGKLALAQLGNRTEACLRSLSSLIHNSPVEIRVKSLSALASLLSLQVCEQTAELLDATQHWFTLLGPSNDTLHHIMSLCRQPFVEQRHATHTLLTSLAILPWGQQKLLNYPGFKEFLLDRTTEHDKNGKEDKYQIVKTLFESPTLKHNADAPFVVKLTEFYREGPFYVAVQAEVALDRDS